MAPLAQYLRARGESGLAALLALRPDLAAPPPTTVRSLAARATTRVSLERALAGVDAEVLQVLEAVLALAGTRAEGPTSAEVAAAVGATPQQVLRPVQAAVELALLVGPTQDEVDGTPLHPCPSLDEVLGPYPAGLGPPLRSTLARRSPEALARLADALAPLVPAADEPPAGDPASAEVLAHHLGDPGTVEALLADSPPGAQQVLDALTWGPPVGRSPEPAAPGSPSPARTAVEWLLRHGLLAVSDSQHVVLPRDVALALRGGRTHRARATMPQPQGRAVDLRTVDAESAHHAEELTRLVARVVDLWGTEPAPVLRSGGLGARELRRLSQRLETSEPSTALVTEVAGAAGLVVDDGEDPPSFVPTTGADDWLHLDLGERWQLLVEAWLASERAAWLVGTRDERGSPRAALDPEDRRPWAPRLRTTVLEVVAAADEPVVLTAEQVHEVLLWRSPRSAPAEHAVEAVLSEAAVLGVVGAGAISTAGRALLARLADPTSTPEPHEALTGQLAPAVGEVLLQGDLTGIVPGRPAPELAALLDLAADVESRGAAVTVRFSPDSIRRALDTGRTAEDLLAELSRHAPTGVPQPLEYLVLDAARRHGQVRVGMASSYLRSDDPALLAGLTEDRALRHLRLLRLAPTVLAAQAAPAALTAALRERGLAPVTEDAVGRVLVSGVTPRRVRLPRSRRPARTGAEAAAQAEHARERRLRRLAKDLLTADRREGGASGDPGHPAPGTGQVLGAGGSASAGGGTADGATGTPDPVLALALLREAAAEGREVWLEIVGPVGAAQRRRVRPLRVDAGRVRAVDAEREAELTVAVHRIASVTPTSGD